MSSEVKRYRLRHRVRPLDVLVAGDGPPLVLLHGWGLSGRAYERAMLALADRGYRVSAPTVSVHQEWSIEAVAETTAEAMAGVETAPAPVIGHSFGGVIAAHVARNHPTFITSFVPVSAPLVTLGGLRLGRIILPGKHYRIMLHAPAATALARAAAAPAGVPSLLRSARWFLGKGHDAPLPAIAATGLPRAVVWASHDALLPRAVGERSAELLECPFVLVTADSGWPGSRPPDHDWPFRYPDHFADTMIHLLTSVAAPRTVLPLEPPRGDEAGA